MADYTPVYVTTEPFTVTASAAVVGGTLAEASTTGAAATAGAASVKVIGVFAHDAASGQRVSVWPIVGNVHEIVHAAGGAVGDCIVAAASGQLATAAAGTASAAGTDLGVALTTAGAGQLLRFIGR